MSCNQQKEKNNQKKNVFLTRQTNKTLTITDHDDDDDEWKRQDKNLGPCCRMSAEQVKVYVLQDDFPKDFSLCLYVWSLFVCLYGPLHYKKQP